MDAPTDIPRPSSSQRQTLGLKFAESRAPETPILDAEGLTKGEAISLVDLARYWARMGKTEPSPQHPSMAECLPALLEAVFDGWDSSEGAPEVPIEPGRNKRDTGLKIGTWEEDLQPSLTETADAWLTLSLPKDGGFKYTFRDAFFRQAPHNKVVVYSPGMSHFKAMQRCISIYDRAEEHRVNDFNKRLVLAMSRRRITGFAQSGNVGDDEGHPEIPREESIEELFVVLRLACDAFDERWDLIARLRGKLGDGSS
ncbi:Hypothetical protein NCS54_00289000 [Fusarium falciforme]|uniref:Hypothetical protein n=1 Tax=Fusarium falciforme TaxID=195108 RepID=UPI0023015D0D|nr:Hypothetical protein NCS54_00289000 [Fusarium falciforme]WAO85642.1 Hypothetical protein NCS54_00289000 [Fusarium falciforme]